MELKVSSLAERPEMHRPVVEMPDTWPELMQHDFTGNAHYDRIATELPEHVLFAEDERGEVVAHAYSVPFALTAPGRGGANCPPVAGTRCWCGRSRTCVPVPVRTR